MVNKIEQKQNSATEFSEINLGDLFENNMDVQSVERNLTRFLKLNKEQFSDFLEFLSHYRERDELSQNFIEQILKRGLEFSQIVIDEKYLDFDREILVELNEALGCHDSNFKNTHPGELNVADKTLLAFPEVYKEFSDGLLQFWVLYHQSNILNLDILFGVLKDMNFDPKVDNSWRSYNIPILQYNIDYGGYDQIIKNDLLANDEENQFCKQLKWLQFLRQIFIETFLEDDYSKYEAFNKMAQIFKELIEKLPNRLLREYLQHALEAEITPLRHNRYLNLDEQNKPHFYNAEMVPENEAERLAEESHYSPKQLENIRFRRQTDFGIKKISADFFGVVDKYGLRYILDKEDKLLTIDAALTENLRADMDVSAKEKIINGALDFSVLTDVFFIDLIKNEMGIDLLNLDLQTQFWFIDFLKDADDAKFLRVVKFVQKFKENGIKTFLALEYDEKNGQKILDIAESLPEDEAREIIDAYGLLVDKTVFLRKDLQNFFITSTLDKKVAENEKKFPAELAEAIRRRASDLFLATQQLELKDQDFKTEDIDTSLKAINLFLAIFADFKLQNKFTFKLERQEEVVEQKEEKISKRIEYLIIDKEKGFQYRFRIFLRPQQNSFGQARLSFSLAFEGQGIENQNNQLKDFFRQSTEDLITNKVTNNKSEFCLRLDLETHYKPTKISLDMGRYQRQEKDKVYSGDKLGNILHQATTTGHHNVGSFAADFGQEDIFAQVINLLGEYFSQENASNIQNVAA